MSSSTALSALGFASLSSVFALLLSRRAAAKAKGRARAQPSPVVDVPADEDVEYAIAFAYSKGIAMGLPSHGFGMAHAPFTLHPRPFPKPCFEQAKRLARPFNILTDRVARNPAWLIATLKRTATVDEFTGRLVQMFETVWKEGIAQTTYLGLHRSDYMIHEGSSHEPKLLQIELNTISAGFGCLSSRIASLHRHMGPRFKEDPDALPLNPAEKALPEAMAAAHRHYCTSRQRPNRGAAAPVVLFLVQGSERNRMDQRLLEFELEAHGVAVIRATHQDMAMFARLGPQKELLYSAGGTSSEREVAVIYFRSGYTPSDYPTEVEWNARLLMERSAAIKAPSLAYHLVGAKKVQQVLAAPEVLEKFMGDLEEQGDLCVDLLRSSFAGLWSLDSTEFDEDTVEAIEEAKKHPDRFVIKPQREGGGNNYFGNDVKRILETYPPEQLSAYILMQRIFPREVEETIVRDGKAMRGPTVCELGVFGVYMSTGTAEATEDVLLNSYGGHLIRSKFVGVDEGGVASGFSALDSPKLIQLRP